MQCRNAILSVFFRDLLRRLFGATLQVKTSQLVSLSEMLDEMVSTGDPYTQSLERDNNLRSNLRSNAEQVSPRASSVVAHV